MAAREDETNVVRERPIAERSVAEILGWRIVSASEGWYINANGRRRNAPPDADDMLAWLQRHSVGGVDSIEPIVLGWDVGVWMPVGPSLMEPEHYTAATLREALEAAVRAVAGEENTDA